MFLGITNRLRFIGCFVLIVCAVLVFKISQDATKDVFSDAIASTFAIGVGLLLFAELAPFITSFKVGGIEFEFAKTVGEKFGDLESRIEKLELKAIDSASKKLVTPSKEPPALARKITEKDDSQKGRFGGKSQVGGYSLTASFKQLSKEFVEVYLIVAHTSSEVLPAGASAVFYLHDTFRPDHQTRQFRDDIAALSLIVYGGFTVGVWIPGPDIELELDLSKVWGAPTVIQEK